MFRLWTKSQHGGSDQSGETQAKEGGTGSSKARGRRPVDPAKQKIDPYVILLLERIAFQTYTGNLDFEQYKKMVKQDAIRSTSTIQS